MYVLCSVIDLPHVLCSVIDLPHMPIQHLLCGKFVRKHKNIFVISIKFQYWDGASSCCGCWWPGDVKAKSINSKCQYFYPLRNKVCQLCLTLELNANIYIYIYNVWVYSIKAFRYICIAFELMNCTISHHLFSSRLGAITGPFHWRRGPLLLIYFNFNPSIDR